MLPTVRLKPGREKPLLRRHPWIFSGAIAEVEGDITSGQTVEVVDSKGNFLAKGAFSPQSQIRVRVWTWNSDTAINEVFFKELLAQAIKTRQEIIDLRDTNAYRLVHGESDGLPGLIADRYQEHIVVQSLSSGSEFWLETIADLLADLTGVQNIYERSDADVRDLEGLPRRRRQLRGNEVQGNLQEDQAPVLVQIIENGIRYWVDLMGGHKTGFYLDQRNNRERVRQLARGKNVLDCFSYTGGFGLSALNGGATSIVSVDTSEEALDLARQNVGLNDYDVNRLEMVEGDVFQILRLFRDQSRSFDLIILDPPKFAPTAAQAQSAARGYKDINLLAFKLLRPGGLLVTFSCSGGVSPDLFQKIVAGAALDAGVEAQIVERLFQGPDHPVGLSFPEGAYLKGLVCRI